MNLQAPSIIDDFTRDHPVSAVGTSWQFLTDGVMGGVSRGAMRREMVESRLALRMRGDVSLENNGGFIQIALDLAPSGAALDASRWQGIACDLCGPEESYGIHLRTSDLERPWQSYRQSFVVKPSWQSFRFAFAAFEPHRTAIPFNPAKLRRLGLVAIGRAFPADLAVSHVGYF